MHSKRSRALRKREGALETGKKGIVSDQDSVSRSVGTNWVQAISELLNEYFVDLLGILLPGMVFTLVVVALIAASGVCLLDAFPPLASTNPENSPFGELLKGQVNAPLFCLIAVIGFVVGGAFFRQNPKVPDRKSMERTLKKYTLNDLSKAEVQLQNQESKRKFEEDLMKTPEKMVGRKWAAEIAKSEGAQFPYTHIKEYLEARGYDYLARIVTREGKDEDFSLRSKLFINRLKIRLDIVAPEKCGSIVKQEAHVRLMSSIWFGSKALLWVCLFSAAPVLVGVVAKLSALVLAATPNPSFFSAMKTVGNGLLSFQVYEGLPKSAPLFFHDLLIYLVLVLSMFIAVFWLIRCVELCFHNQRVREVFYVLETAYFVEQLRHPETLEILPWITQGEKKAISSVPIDSQRTITRSPSIITRLYNKWILRQ